ncbi:MAG: hypothetical protein K0R13_3501 [Propionibacteriaceae bacterium]|nr:hypothetical protein [Propionibacteriaceae bacterium]
MTEVFTADTTIDRSVDVVWARLIDRGPTEIGTTLIFTTRGKERTGQIAALNPGRSITLRSVQGGVTADYVYKCSGYGDGTRVRLLADCSMTGPVRLLSPLIRSAIRRADSGQLDAFAATFTRE